MANNRAYLCCRFCAENPEATAQQYRFFLMKYYPSTGWYVPSASTAALNAWLDTHRHGSMYGDFMTLVDESSDSTQDTKRGVLNILSGAAES